MGEYRLSILRLKFATQIAHFATLFEKKGTFYKKRGPKGDPFGPKGPQRGPGFPKGDPIGHTVTMLLKGLKNALFFAFF